MADVDMADVAALRPLAAHRLMDRPEGRSPAHDRQPAAGVAKANILLGHMVGDAVHLTLADVGHRLVVGGAIVVVAGAVLLFGDAAAVHQSGCRKRVVKGTSVS